MSNPLPPLASGSDEIAALVASIKITNNGYLFAPNQHQITIAKANPHIFDYSYNRNAAFSFPHKIALVK